MLGEQYVPTWEKWAEGQTNHAEMGEKLAKTMKVFSDNNCVQHQCTLLKHPGKYEHYECSFIF